MKTYWLNYTLAVLLGTTPLASAAQKATTPEVLRVPAANHITINPALLKPVTGALKLYELARPEVTEGRWQELARSIAMADGSVRQGRGLLQMTSAKDPSLYASFKLSTGDLTLHKSMLPYYGDRVPKLPGADEVARLAILRLTELKLLPGHGDELLLVHNGGLRMTGAEDGKPGLVIDKLRTLTFGRQLDDLPVIGPGSKIVVDIGDNGELIGLLRRWREVGQGKAIPADALKSRAVAEREINDQLQKEWAGAEPKLEQVTLAYYDAGGRYIQPAFVYQATVLSGKIRVPYLGVIAAMNQSPEPLGPPEVPREALGRIQQPKPGGTPNIR